MQNKLTRKQEMDLLVSELMLQCPYPYNSKEYWIYNAGLMGSILARYAQYDCMIKQELRQRIARAKEQ